MASEELQERIEALFRETASAHHEAFRETDGADPEWPLWYAEHMRDPLAELLGAKFTKSELVYLIISADGEHAARAPGSKWSRHWARFFLARYA